MRTVHDMIVHTLVGTLGVHTGEPYTYSLLPAHY